MTGKDLAQFRQRYGLSRLTVAKMLKQKDHMRIYHWEKGYYPIPKKYQLIFGQIFATLEANAPPTECCPLCNGVGLIGPQKEPEDTPAPTHGYLTRREG